MEEPDSETATDGRSRGSRGASGCAGEDVELRETIVEAITTLPTQSKLVLLAVVSRDRRGSGPSSTGEVYNTYEGLCDGTPVDPLSQRRVTDLIDELDTFGLVSADVVSEGRFGRTREIQASVAPAPTRELLVGDEKIGTPELHSGST